MSSLSLLDSVLTEKAYICFKAATASTGGMSISSLASSALSSAASSLGVSTGATSGKLEVQYNPSSLDFTVKSVTQKKKENFSRVVDEEGNTETVEKEVVTSKKEVTMKTTLYFYGQVKDQAEALLAASRNPLKKEVTFIWGANAFVGKLENVSVEYNMFDEKGYPLHAKVGIEIRSVGTSNQNPGYLQKANKLF